MTIKLKLINSLLKLRCFKVLKRYYYGKFLLSFKLQKNENRITGDLIRLSVGLE